MSRRAVALLLGLLVAAGAVPARATASPAAPIIEPSFAPEADARVVKASPDTNFGTQTVLEADNSPVVESLLRFTVSGISGAVSRARLRLFVTDSSSNGPALYRTEPTSWTETGVTWNNRPARTGAALGNLGSASSGRYVEYDVTSAVAGDGTYTFTLVADSTDGTDFSSREAATNRPQLVVETGSGGGGGGGSTSFALSTTATSSRAARRAATGSTGPPATSSTASRRRSSTRRATTNGRTAAPTPSAAWPSCAASSSPPTSPSASTGSCSPASPPPTWRTPAGCGAT